MNKVFFIVLGIIGFASFAGLSTEFVNLNVQDFKLFDSMTDFDEAVCTCEGEDGSISKENCQQFAGDITDLNGVCILHPDADIEDYGELPIADEACGVGFWKSKAFESEVLSIWPAGYTPDDYYNDLFQTTFGTENVNEQEQDVVIECNMNTSPEFGGCTAEELAILNQQDIDETEVRDEVNDETEVNDADDVPDNGPTLLEALNANGGETNLLIRASATALLNSAHSEVSYQYSVQEVISMTQDSINNENYQDLTDIFEELNEQGVEPPLCVLENSNSNAP